MKRYQFAMILEVPAENYEDALKDAKLFDRVFQDTLEEGTSPEDPSLKLVLDYETDNEGQRVVYLPKVNDDDN
jgi:hypothetical protein